MCVLWPGFHWVGLLISVMPAWPTEARAQMRDFFLLKLLATEAATLIYVGLLAVMGHDYFAWLLS